MKNLIRTLVFLCLFISATCLAYTPEDGKKCQQIVDDYVSHIKSLNAEAEAKLKDVKFILTGTLLDCLMGYKAVVRLELLVKGLIMAKDKKDAPPRCLYKFSVQSVRKDEEVEFIRTVLVDEDPIIGPCELIQEDIKNLLAKYPNPKKPETSKK